jgi:hypothetical protein
MCLYYILVIASNEHSLLDLNSVDETIAVVVPEHD